MHRSILLGLLGQSLGLLFLAAACGPAPVPLENEPASSSAPQPLPPNHPPLDAQPPVSGIDFHVQGVVRLRGDLATRDSGFVFVSVKPQGIVMPSYSRKYAYSDPAITSAADGERVLTFELDESHLQGGLVPGEHVIEAMFDPDGYVDTKDGVIRRSMAVKPGDSGIEIVLDPGPSGD